MASYDVDSQYLRESDNLGLMAIRPFGLMLQPQKSGFVFVSESSFSTLEIDFLIVISLIYGTFFCCSNFSYWCQDSTIMCVGFVDCNKIEYILGAENDKKKIGDISCYYIRIDSL